MRKNLEAKPLVSVGFLSGLNFGSEGCREGLWRLSAEKLKKEHVNFAMIVGGLVDSKSLLEQLKSRLTGVTMDARESVTDNFIKEIVEHLKKNIPKLHKLKIYLITSPAYDGWIGERVARGLAEKRKDILLYRSGGDRLEIKQLSRILGAYAPKKGVWMRGDYYDTPILRVLKDEIKRSTRGIGDMNVVGCHASSIFNPGDSSDVQRPYLSLPAIYKIAETRTAENQIGIRILKFYSKNAKEAMVVTYNFKDLVSEEWRLVQTPQDSSAIQKMLVDTIKARGPMTIGQFADFTGFGREEIKRELELLIKRRVGKSWPGIVEDEVSKRYYFEASWFHEKLEYPEVVCDRTDSIMAFGCLHAACKHTDMKFFRDALPDLMLENNANILCGAGDFIEGLRHDLMVKGEVYGSRKYSFNYTYQEKLAAYLVSQVIAKVFRARMNPSLKFLKSDEQEKLKDAILEALPRFIYIPGNHCEWTAPLGFSALSVFGIQLRKLVVEDVLETLYRAKLFFPNVAKLVESKIVELSQNESYTLPSGLTLSNLHPYMSRTKTTSIRPQEMLQKATTNIVVGANFHVAEAVEQWEFGMGQRVCLQVGTIKHRSGFEDTKLKTVDFGVGFLRVCSSKKRIMRTETAFFGTPTPNLEEANNQVLDDFDRRLGL